jgi:hypothetical protein
MRMSIIVLLIFHHHEHIGTIKAKIDSLEAECNMLRNLVLNLSKGSQSIASNYRMSTNFIHPELKEDDTIHQMLQGHGHRKSGVPSYQSGVGNRLIVTMFSTKSYVLQNN